MPAVDPPPQRVEVVVSVRTLFVLLAFGAVVALAVFSLATLLSIFVAAVLALGLDPVVGALVRRGWGVAGRRWRCSRRFSRPRRRSC